MGSSSLALLFLLLLMVLISTAGNANPPSHQACTMSGRLTHLFLLYSEINPQFYESRFAPKDVDHRMGWRQNLNWNLMALYRTGFRRPEHYVRESALH